MTTSTINRSLAHKYLVRAVVCVMGIDYLSHAKTGKNGLPEVPTGVVILSSLFVIVMSPYMFICDLLMKKIPKRLGIWNLRSDVNMGGWIRHTFLAYLVYLIAACAGTLILSTFTHHIGPVGRSHIIGIAFIASVVAILAICYFFTSYMRKLKFKRSIRKSLKKWGAKDPETKLQKALMRYKQVYRGKQEKVE